MAAQAGLCLTWSKTPKTGFLMMGLKYLLFVFPDSSDEDAEEKDNKAGDKEDHQANDDDDAFFKMRKVSLPSEEDILFEYMLVFLSWCAYLKIISK